MKFLNAAVHAAGLAICIWAFMKCRSRGYLVIGSYYLLAVCSLIFTPFINRSNREYQHKKMPEHVLSVEGQKQYGQELAALHAKYFPDIPGPGIESTISISYPVGPIILLLGVWILARRESKGSSEQNGAGNSHRASQ